MDIGEGVVNYLRKYALSNLWANVHADNQVLIKTTRLSRDRGHLGSFSRNFIRMALPKSDQWFHVYGLGKISPHKLNLDNLGTLGWVSIKEIINEENVLVNITTEGRFIRNDHSYLRLLYNGLIVLAVARDENVGVLDIDKDVYIRFYKAPNYLNNADIITTTDYVTDTSTVAGYSVFYSAYSAALDVAIPNIYMDGYLLPDGVPAYSTLPNKSVLQMVVDNTVSKKTTQTFHELPTYTSTLDSAVKYIYSISGPSDNIFTDDIDFYISGIKPGTTLRKGVLLNRYLRRDIRMLTYKDWSISSPMINAALDELTTLLGSESPLEDVKVHAYHRENGEIRNTLLDKNRLKDLISLPTDIRLSALRGLHAVIPEWEADNVEQSPVNQWIGLEAKELEVQDLSGVYSRYGAISAIERVFKNESGNWALPALAGNAGGVLIRYDGNGNNPGDVSISPGNNYGLPYIGGLGTELFLPNEGVSTDLDAHIGINTLGTVDVPDSFGIFCYMKEGTTLEKATVNVDYKLIESENTITVEWLLPSYSKHKYVRKAQDRSMIEKTYTFADLLNGIPLYADDITYQNEIGMGHLFVWINGSFIYEGLDYEVADGKLYLFKVDTGYDEGMDFKIIYVGLPDDSFKHVNKCQWGFITFGMMSYNGKYDLYLNRNNALFVEGKSISREDIFSNEKFTDVISTNDHTNGRPWGVVPYPQFTADYTLDSIVESIEDEKALDQSIEDYLTTQYKQNTESGIILIPSRYDLVSMYMNKIITDIYNGTLVITTSIYTKEELEDFLSAYDTLLQRDPTQKGLDSKYVIIRPLYDTTPLEVSLLEFTFVEKVNTLILDGQVSLINDYLTIV